MAALNEYDKRSAENKSPYQTLPAMQEHQISPTAKLSWQISFGKDWNKSPFIVFYSQLMLRFVSQVPSTDMFLAVSIPWSRRYFNLAMLFDQVRTLHQTFKLLMKVESHLTTFSVKTCRCLLISLNKKSHYHDSKQSRSSSPQSPLPTHTSSFSLIWTHILFTDVLCADQ